MGFYKKTDFFSQSSPPGIEVGSIQWSAVFSLPHTLLAKLITFTGSIGLWVTDIEPGCAGTSDLSSFMGECSDYVAWGHGQDPWESEANFVHP